MSNIYSYTPKQPEIIQWALYLEWQSYAHKFSDCRGPRQILAELPDPFPLQDTLKAAASFHASSAAWANYAKRTIPVQRAILDRLDRLSAFVFPHLKSITSNWIANEIISV